MTITHSSPIGQEVLSGGHPLILGISLGNRYFKSDNLAKLISWSTANKRKTYLMIPDEPYVHTLRAISPHSIHAKRDSRLKAHNVENKCQRIAAVLERNAVVIRWKSVSSNEFYQLALQELLLLYQHHPQFKCAVQEMTIHVLQSAGIPIPPSTSIEIGVHFVLEEFAFITRADKILGEKMTAYVYHKPTPVLFDLLDGTYPFKPGAVGYITVE